MIELQGLTKRFGDTIAVDDLTLTIGPGRVTGFLGPNGAGKSTTMRLILGLERPTAGSALVDGRSFAHLRQPLRRVGALLSAEDVHPGRTARAHLRIAARTNDIAAGRVEEVLTLAGLGAVADRRIRTYSLGMRQRLGMAAALLGDPGIVMFDEPVNGLDLDGIRWVRELVRRLADEGRTVLVSSHLLSEMQRTADHLIVIGGGRLVADAPTAEVVAGASSQTVQVRSPDAEILGARLRASGLAVDRTADDELLVVGTTTADVGDLATELRLRIHGLTETPGSLEEAYMDLTADSIRYGSVTDHPEELR